MLKRNIRFVIIFISMIVIYAVMMSSISFMKNDRDSAPSISFDQDVIEVSVGDGDDILLKGVQANDEEDGNISDKVFIYNMSAFDQNMSRTVTYAVFDSKDQMSTATRYLKYSDYTKPRFSSSKPLMNMATNSDKSKIDIKASSVVDGDITNKVSVSAQTVDDVAVYTFSVTDSTGMTSTLVVNDELNLKGILTNVDINLNEYIIYVEKGTELKLRSYIKDVKTSLGTQSDLKYDVNIESNYNPNEEGVYEAKYTLNRSNGDYGVTKLIIVVE